MKRPSPRLLLSPLLCTQGEIPGKTPVGAPPSPQKCGAFILNLRKEVKVKLTEDWGARGAGCVDQLGHKPALRVRPRGFALCGCKIWT